MNILWNYRVSRKSAAWLRHPVSRAELTVAAFFFGVKVLELEEF
jgi:hypothetical protein